MDKLSLCVFTTRKVIIEQAPILRVIYDEDGFLQFFAGEDFATSDNAMIVSLGEILQIDSSLQSIINSLSIGQTAYRKDVQSSWIVKESL